MIHDGFMQILRYRHKTQTTSQAEIRKMTKQASKYQLNTVNQKKTKHISTTAN